ncbi:MAG: glucosamine-6-phosphate deaminase NagB-II [Aestuariibacter sp.]
MSSIMAEEARQVPEVVAAQIEANTPVINKLVATLKLINPSFVMMVGRGSSDHAGVFGKYLIETELGLPVTFAAPSVVTVYNRSLQLKGAVAIIISQSGKSPDLLAQTKNIKDSGAYCIALVNDESSPLAQLVDVAIPLRAGPELAVAATKSYLCTLTALLNLVALWKGDKRLLQDLGKLPEAFHEIIAGNALLTAKHFQDVKHLVVLGRGFGYAISREIALKLKEVLGIHAEAFSSAEFVHGPVTLAERTLHVVAVSVEDESASIHETQLADVARRGAIMSRLGHDTTKLHKRLLPLLVMLRFYLDVEAIAQTFGLDPDAPPGLRKVTETI